MPIITMASLWRFLHVPLLAVENTDKRIRHFMPGDTDLSGVTQQQLVDLTYHLNSQPRKCLGYKTPLRQAHYSKRVGEKVSPVIPSWRRAAGIGVSRSSDDASAATAGEL
ncbi:hypothetical protein ACVMIX_007396 [Rhizobium leguminosarum]